MRDLYEERWEGADVELECARWAKEPVSVPDILCSPLKAPG